MKLPLADSRAQKTNKNCWKTAIFYDVTILSKKVLQSLILGLLSAPLPKGNTNRLMNAGVAQG